MKFSTAAALTLAMAAGAQSSLIPLAHHGLAISAPLHVVSAAQIHHPGSLAIHASTAELHHGLHGVLDGAWHGDLNHGLHGVLDGAWVGDLHHGLHGALDGTWREDSHPGHHAAVVVNDHHVPSPALIVDAHHTHVPSPALIVNDHSLHAQAPIVHVAHPHHEGHYVAKTRGAVHSAPLSGHAASAASINLQPAPGTV